MTGDSSANNCDQLLQSIDPASLTIPYVYLLHSLLESAVKANHSSSRSLPQSLLPDGELWPAVTAGLLAFEPIQMRYVGPQLMRIVETVYYGAEQTSNFVPAIQLLQNLIFRLDPQCCTLSTTHCYYLKLCLYARAYTEATNILDFPIYHVPTSESTKTLEKRLGKYLCSQQESSLAYINPQSGLSGKITSRIYLEYYLLGALCYTGTEQWKKAQAFLEVVLVAPTQQNVASLIMLEAYKKWLLLGLIIKGQAPDLPRAMGANAAKHIRILAKPYECVVEAFKTNKLEALHAEIQEGLDIWQQDGNYGLMVEVSNAFRKFAVMRLSKTFAALPIEEVAQRTSSSQPQDIQETLAYVQRLIATGELQATITPSQAGGLGTVRFLPPTAAHKSEQQVEQELRAKTIKLKVLLKHVSDYDHQLAANKDYVEWLTKLKKARDQDKKAGDKGIKGVGGPPVPGDFPDEDMMDEW